MLIAAGAAFLCSASLSLAAADVADGPFTFEASVGPQASARVDARVTRTVGGVRVSLPAAIVPALEPGDVIDVRFPDYTQPAARANYHVNVAFITEVAPQRWLFDRSGPQDRLFASPRKRRGQAQTPPAPGLHFIYGTPEHRGIPIFFIVPEDGKTRGMDGVRDYVDAHPTDFKNMAESANDAADRYVWFSDFLSSLANGSIDPISARQRVESVTTSLGANPAEVDACYAVGGSRASVADCIKSQLTAVSYQTNISAPTQAQFFGGAVGATAPVQIAAYLIPLLSVWKLFASTGHREFEYLPTMLMLGARGAGSERELLMGLKVPSLRPPAAFSDALFFTIGDPQAATVPPTVINTADSGGFCVAGARVGLPLHLDRTSAYVHDTSVVIAPDGGAPYARPLDPHSIDTPAVAATDLHGSDDGAYTVRLAGRFGFDPIRQPAMPTARIVVPRSADWSIASAPHHPPVAGGTFDEIAAAAVAPCVSRAELQIGNAPPIPLELKHLSDRRLALHGSIEKVPPGPAHLRLYETDALHDTEIESDVDLAIAARPARVDATHPPVVSIGDPFIEIDGSALESVSALRLGGNLYDKTPGSDAGTACFAGPPIGAALQAGQSLSAQLIGPGETPGEVFVTTLAPARPIVSVNTLGSNESEHLATHPLAIELTTMGDLPPRRIVRLRPAAGTPNPCAAVADDPAASVTLGPNPGFELAPTRLRLDLDAQAALADRAFGRLELQLVDGTTNRASAWATIPGTFVRAPRVSRIACPLDPTATCRLLGTELDAIAGVEDDGGGGTVAPGPACPSPEKGQACLIVPRREHYVFTLRDSGETLAVPDALITNGPPPPEPSSAPGASPPPAQPSSA